MTDASRYETWEAAALSVAALAVRYEMPDDDIDLVRALDKLREIAPPKPSADAGAAYLAQMERLAEIGAALCCYAPGTDNPEKWPESHCDCKRLPVGHDLVAGIYLSGEATGCCEVRAAWRALDTLRKRADESAGRD